jgi:hypothetical protein
LDQRTLLFFHLVDIAGLRKKTVKRVLLQLSLIISDIVIVVVVVVVVVVVGSAIATTSFGRSQIANSRVAAIETPR